MKIDLLAAPAMITWQLTRDCNLACLHCCTDSAPGRALVGELTRAEALKLCDEIVAAQVPYVMLVGGEPTIVPWFFEAAEKLGQAGVLLKIETNGQALTAEQAARLVKLPVRSVQVSIDGATQEIYGKMRPGGSLDAVKRSCALVRRHGLPLEITFAPTALNVHEAGAVIDLALELGAFRFNSGRLMRLGTAAKLWPRLCPDGNQYQNFYNLLLRKEGELAGRLELCFRPFSLAEELSARKTEPSATLLVLPDGRVKVSAPLPFTCADLKTQSLSRAWAAYRAAWSHPRVIEALALSGDESRLAEANRWERLEENLPAVV